MTSFFVLGSGFAALRVADAIATTPRARLISLACMRPPASGFVTLPSGNDVAAVPIDSLTRETGIQTARELGADWLLCINSTLIVPISLLEAFNGRALNAHPGPLPEYAGLHAHQWALRNGAVEYGATVHRMDMHLDAGPIVASTRFPIREDDTGLSLFRRALAASADLLVGVVKRVMKGERLPSSAQDLSRRHVYRWRDAGNGTIDWQLPARDVVNFVRAGNYEPFASPTYVARMETPFGNSIEVLRAALAGPTAGRPGSLVGFDEAGPLIACGDGNAVRITRARSSGAVVEWRAWRDQFEIQ